MCAYGELPSVNLFSLDVSNFIRPSMTSTTQLSVRINPANPNHHLWNNHGTWFIHYVVHPTPYTKERIRHSLHTKSLEEARERRDALLAVGSEPLPSECVRSPGRKSSQPNSSVSRAEAHETV